MNLMQEYRSKLCTAEEAVRLVKSGDWVDYGSNNGYPSTLDAALARRRDELHHVKVRGNLLRGPLAVVECDPSMEHFVYDSWHCSGYERKLCDAGRAFFTPMLFRDLDRYYHQYLTVDVAMLSVAPMDENGYSRLLKLRFSTFVGAEEKDPVLIDLSLDCAPTGVPVVADPVRRIQLEGVESSPYVLYPVCDQLADKLCAAMEVQPGGYPSSRMKDLVDIVLVARTQELDWGDLRLAVVAECARRGMAVPGCFEAPAFWRAGFERFARRQGVDVTFDGACEVAGALFDPVLGDVACGTWHPEGLRWDRC